MINKLYDIALKMVGYFVLGFVVVVANSYYNKSHYDAMRQIKDTNEIKALLYASGEDNAGSTTVVGVLDLLSTYHNSPVIGNGIYTHKKIRVPIKGSYYVRGRSIHWHLGDPTIPAVIVFEFSEPPIVNSKDKVIWITGICEGFIRDGVKRDIDDFDFFVKVNDCQLAK